MVEKCVIILSKNKNMSRFFELEAVSLGLSTTVSDKRLFDISEYSAAIIDTDSLTAFPKILPEKVFFVSEDEESEYKSRDGFLLYPLMLSKLREIYNSILSVVPSVPASTDEAFGKDIIYFFKNSDNTVQYAGKKVCLSDGEMKVLKLLCENCGHTVKRSLISEIFNGNNGNTADVYIHKLRKKLCAVLNKNLIFTVRNDGYMINSAMEWK